MEHLKSGGAAAFLPPMMFTNMCYHGFIHVLNLSLKSMPEYIIKWLHVYLTL